MKPKAFDFTGSWDKFITENAVSIQPTAMISNKVEGLICFCSFEMFEKICRKYPDMIKEIEIDGE